MTGKYDLIYCPQVRGQYGRAYVARHGYSRVIYLQRIVEEITQKRVN